MQKINNGSIAKKGIYKRHKFTKSFVMPNFHSAIQQSLEILNRDRQHTFLT